MSCRARCHVDQRSSSLKNKTTEAAVPRLPRKQNETVALQSNPDGSESWLRFLCFGWRRIVGVARLARGRNLELTGDLLDSVSLFSDAFRVRFPLRRFDCAAQCHRAIDYVNIDISF